MRLRPFDMTRRSQQTTRRSFKCVSESAPRTWRYEIPQSEIETHIIENSAQFPPSHSVKVDQQYRYSYGALNDIVTKSFYTSSDDVWWLLNNELEKRRKRHHGLIWSTKLKSFSNDWRKSCKFVYLGSMPKFENITSQMHGMSYTHSSPNLVHL
jgi:hypothetical protein